MRLGDSGDDPGLGHPGGPRVRSRRDGLLLCVAAAGTLRRGIGWVLAWSAQAACVALGFAVDMMLVVGIMFLVLFGISFLLGRRLEAAKSAG